MLTTLTPVHTEGRSRTIRSYSRAARLRICWPLALILCCAIAGCRIPGVDTQNPNYHYSKPPASTNAFKANTESVNLMPPTNLVRLFSTRAITAPPSLVSTSRWSWTMDAVYPGLYAAGGGSRTNERYFVTWLERSTNLAHSNWLMCSGAYTPQPTNFATLTNFNPMFIRAVYGYRFSP